MDLSKHGVTFEKALFYFFSRLMENTSLPRKIIEIFIFFFLYNFEHSQSYFMDFFHKSIIWKHLFFTFNVSILAIQLQNSIGYVNKLTIDRSYGV